MRLYRFITLSLISSCACLCASADEEVLVSNESAGITLSGTLTAPESTPKATIVMATGSGLQDRDETIAGHKPFKVIADRLTANGYAVLRMDDRGYGQSEGDGTTATTDDFASDIAAGLQFMADRYPGVRRGVIGHSDGGTIAIKLGAADKCDFIVTLAAPAVAGDSLIMSQSRALALAMTGDASAFEREAPLQRRLLATVKSDMPAPVKRVQLLVAVNEAKPGQLDLPAVRQYFESQIDGMLSPWYVAAMRYDPSDDIRSITLPWLALNGTRDLQVTPDNLDTISSLNPAATTVSLPGLNHLFQTCDTGLPTEYGTISEDINPEVLQIIVKWLDEICQ